MTPYCTKIGLGTVQFGLNYGISNKNGQVNEEEAARILRTASDNGITVLDTAAAYGNSEEILGKALPKDKHFHIVTKIPKIGSETKDIKKTIRKIFDNSLQKIGCSSLYALMFHDADDLISSCGAEIYQAVAEIKNDGLIQKIGVSVYTQKQLEAIRQRFDIELVQVPVNVFDQRLVQNGYLQELCKNGVEIHSRSAFLQGLILMEPDEVRPYFEPVKPVLTRFRQTAQELGVTPLLLALAFVLQLECLSTVIVGVTLQKELAEIIEAVRYIEENPINIDFSAYGIDDTAILNPSLWK